MRTRSQRHRLPLLTRTRAWIGPQVTLVDTELAAARAELVQADVVGAARAATLQRDLEALQARNNADAAECDRIEGLLRGQRHP